MGTEYIISDIGRFALHRSSQGSAVTRYALDLLGRRLGLESSG
jgi:hypothetical protein